MRVRFFALTLISCLLAAACSGKGEQTGLDGPPSAALEQQMLQPQADQAPQLSEDAGLPLPAIADLDRLASSPFDYSDQQKHGSDWDEGLPNFNATGGTFRPGINEDTLLHENAYAIYSWTGMEELQGDVSITPIWFDPVPSPDEMAIAIANYASGRWDWQAGQAGQLHFGARDDYLSGLGNIYVAFMLTGNAESTLQLSYLGDVPPWLNVDDDLDNDELLNIAPREVTLDASGSFPTINPISHFDFDWDGDGTYEILGDTEGIASHEYGEGNHQAVVRIHDTEGLSDTVTRRIDIVDPENIAPTASFTADVSSGPAPLTVQFDPATSMDPDGQIVEYRWDLDNDGKTDEESEGPDPVSFTYTTFGDHTVTLEVEDNYFAVHSMQLVISTTTGWTSSMVTGGLHPGTDLAMATSGAPASEHASIAYVDSAGKLRVISATSDEGSAWGAVQDPAPVEDRLDDDSTLKLLGHGSEDRLMLAWDLFDNFSGGQQIFQTAALDGTWDSGQLVNDSGDISLRDMQLVGGIPCIGGIDMEGVLNFSYPVIFLATDAAASDWGSMQAVAGGLSGLRCQSLAVGSCTVDAEEYPLVVYDMNSPSEALLFARRATMTDGSAWEEVHSRDGVSLNSLELTQLAGLPVISWGRLSVSGVHLLPADDAAASAFSAAPAEISESGTFNMVFGMAGGLPVMAAYDNRRDRVVLYRAADAGGSSWLGPEIVTEDPQAERTIAMTVVNDAVQIAWINAADELLCAWYMD